MTFIGTPMFDTTITIDVTFTFELPQRHGKLFVCEGDIFKQIDE
jgi:hypothetical protein